VPPVRRSPATTADVEAVLVAFTQPERDASIGAGRFPEPRVESRVPRWAQPKS
jgi:hypothetical protein